jgi:hypothetical protein
MSQWEKFLKKERVMLGRGKVFFKYSSYVSSESVDGGVSDL